MPEGTLSKVSRNILRERKNLFLDIDGVLMRRSGKVDQIVLPEKRKSMIYKQLHCEMGHLGAERVFQLARQRVYWPNMFTEIETYTQKICRCIAQKVPHRKMFAPLQSIHSSCPLDLVAIDYLKLEESSAGHEYVLLIVDHFTRYAVGYPCKNKSALTAAKCIYNDFLLKRLGIPARIMHDQGKEFENKLFASLESYCGLMKSRTTPYHPQTNGCVERMNETLLKMLRALPEKRKGRWHQSIDKVLFAYNATKHESTGYSPYYLMFGREPILPLDLILGINNQKKFLNRPDFVKHWKEEMEEAYHIARGKSRKRKEADEKRWKNRLIVTAVKPGDKVLVKNVREKGGPGKIRAFWEQDVYRVLEVQGPSDVIVKIQKENCPTGEKRVVHRNMILPCEMLDIQQMKDDTTDMKAKKVTKAVNKAPADEKDIPESHQVNSDDSDFSEDELIDVVHQPCPVLRPRPRPRLRHFLTPETSHPVRSEPPAIAREQETQETKTAKSLQTDDSAREAQKDEIIPSNPVEDNDRIKLFDHEREFTYDEDTAISSDRIVESDRSQQSLAINNDGASQANDSIVCEEEGDVLNLDTHGCSTVAEGDKGEIEESCVSKSLTGEDIPPIIDNFINEQRIVDLGENEDTRLRSSVEESGITPRTQQRCESINNKIEEWKEKRAGLNLSGTDNEKESEVPTRKSCRRSGSRTPSEERRDRNVSDWRTRREEEVEQRRGIQKAPMPRRSGRERRLPSRLTYNAVGNPSIEAVSANSSLKQASFPVRPTSLSPPPNHNYYTKNQRQAY